MHTCRESVSASVPDTTIKLLIIKRMLMFYLNERKAQYKYTSGTVLVSHCAVQLARVLSLVLLNYGIEIGVGLSFLGCESVVMIVS